MLVNVGLNGWCIEEKEIPRKVLVGRNKGKRSFSRHGLRLQDKSLKNRMRVRGLVYMAEKYAQGSCCFEYVRKIWVPKCRKFLD